MDESRLYYRALPAKTLCFKEAVKGGKTIKHITLLLVVNMDGSDKSLSGFSSEPTVFPF